MIQGRGGKGYLKFGNRKPSSGMPLTFNIGPKHLKDCDSKYIQFSQKFTLYIKNIQTLLILFFPIYLLDSNNRKEKKSERLTQQYIY